MTSDSPISITPTDLRKIIRSETNGPKKVGLDKSTWVAVIGLTLALLTSFAAFSTFIFQTRLAAAETRAADHATSQTQHVEMMESFQATVEKHSEKPHRGAALQSDFHRLDKKISIIGDRVGAGRAIRKIDAEGEIE